MQNAKDTFFEVLQGRLASVNPARVATVRGAVRPAIVVEENELSEVALPRECFCLRWVSAGVEESGAMPRVVMRCEIRYATAGAKEAAGMDRGRVLSAMDAELRAVVNEPGRVASKVDYTGLPYGRTARTMATNVWWSAVSLGALTEKDGVLERVATVDVMAFEEAGER